jgi:hypothetical protein
MTDKVYINYALQTCDVKSHQGQPRYCGDNRTQLSKKSIKSLCDSIKFAADKNANAYHTLKIIDDNSTAELVDYIYATAKNYEQDNFKIIVEELKTKGGLSNSIRACYEWLRDTPADLVYQVQDDYIYYPTAIHEMLQVWYQILHETEKHCIVNPWNDSWLWLTFYRNRATPRTVIVGQDRYWIQYYDMSCSFLTSHLVFTSNYDLMEMFLFLVDNRPDKDLENKSLNYLLTERGILGIVPVNSLALHVQSELEKDPHIDWEELWNSISE